MLKFTPFVSRVAALPVDNIDTDQIIPARYLKATSKQGMGEALFADWRYEADGTPRAEFVLNLPASRAVQILLAGANFGCGSSREHAAWALTGFGFRAVISTSFADIFRNNALKNGLLPVAVIPEEYAALLALVQKNPAAELRIDLESQSVELPDGTKFSFPIDPFSKTCFLKGVDELGYLQSFAGQIAAYELKETAR